MPFLNFSWGWHPPPQKIHPLLLHTMSISQITQEDREELRMDREKAMKCEEVLARRKQEKYFQLVDEIQNVLKRIEVWKYFGLRTGKVNIFATKVINFSSRNTNMYKAIFSVFYDL